MRKKPPSGGCRCRWYGQVVHDFAGVTHIGLQQHFAGAGATTAAVRSLKMRLLRLLIRSIW